LVEATARPSSAVAARPYVGVVEVERPSLVEAMARPSSAVAGRPSAAVEVPARRGLPAVVVALPHAPPVVAGLAAAQAAIEVSEQPQRRALAARRRVAGLRPLAAGLREPWEQPSRWRVWSRQHRQERSARLIPAAKRLAQALRSD
jgi:hypothetical protein